MVSVSTGSAASDAAGEDDQEGKGSSESQGHGQSFVRIPTIWRLF